FAFSSDFTAALPSGQTVTSCPKRGNSERMNSCNDFSSSANRMRRLLCGGVAKRLLLAGLVRDTQRQAHGKGATLARSRTDGLDLSSVSADNLMADAQTQPSAFTSAVTREEWLKDVLQCFSSHAASGIGEHHGCHTIFLREHDCHRTAFVHAVESVDDEV